MAIDTKIFGIGVDSVTISRIEKSLENEAFLAKVFSQQEQNYLATKKNALLHQSAAACFAAKEAFLKATGTGIGGFKLAEISVSHHESGAPFFSFEGVTKDFCKSKNISAHLSITHEADTATAFVILEYFETPPKFALL